MGLADFASNDRLAKGILLFHMEQGRERWGQTLLITKTRLILGQLSTMDDGWIARLALRLHQIRCCAPTGTLQTRSVCFRATLQPCAYPVR